MIKLSEALSSYDGVDWTNARFSSLFSSQVEALLAGPGARAILHEVRHLEGDKISSCTESPRQFDRAELKGLWKKHYFRSGHLAKNVGNYWFTKKGKGDFEALMRDPKCIGLPIDASHEIAKRVVDETVELKKIMTGEWIVFHWDGVIRTYLTLAEHNEGDIAIRKRIERYCVNEFPGLGLLPAL
ncbi:hypothetical protein V2L05_03235 [Pseudomonas alliivorans]|nr:hypothetical protein [Pseudomonas alliivorans]